MAIQYMMSPIAHIVFTGVQLSGFTSTTTTTSR